MIANVFADLCTVVDSVGVGLVANDDDRDTDGVDVVDDALYTGTKL